MELLTIEKLRAIQDMNLERVQMPEWGGDIILRSVTGKTKDAFDNARMSRAGDGVQTNLENYRAALVALCMCDEAGNPIFADHREGAELLGQRSSRSLQRAFEVALRLNGVTQEEVAEQTKSAA